MESEKILNAKLLNLSSTSAYKAMPNEPAQKPPPQPPSTLLDRFKALLKQRDDERRAVGEQDVPPPSTEEVVQLYELVLAELTFNSKPLITDLTIIAGEHRDHGQGIADAICLRILEVPAEQKLPTLYLLDSVVKNIGREYVRYFSSRLPEVFCEAYRQVPPNLHPSMRHLFGTWASVFPASVLHRIEMQLQLSPSTSQEAALRASEPSRPASGIHVNPKYLRQLGHSRAENNTQHLRGTSSNLNASGESPAIGFDGYDSDHSEVGTQRLNAVGGFGRPSFPVGGSKALPASSSRIARPTLASGRMLSSEVDDIAGDGSPRRFSDGASPSNPGFDYGRGRLTDRDNEFGDWRRKPFPDNKRSRLQSPVTYSLSNGHDHERTRALIDAYGTDAGERSQSHRSIEMNGVDIKVAAKSWQNTEEEEFDWKDMRPTSDLATSVQHLGSSRERPDLGRFGASYVGFDARAHPSGRRQLLLADNLSNEPGRVLGSRYPQDAWHTSHNLSESSSIRGRGKELRPPITVVGMSSHGESGVSLIDKRPGVDVPYARSPVLPSRMGSSVPDSFSGGPAMAALQPSSGFWPHATVHGSQPAPVPPSLISNQLPRPHFLPQDVPSAMAPRPLSVSATPLSRSYPRQGQNTVLSTIPTKLGPAVRSAVRPPLQVQSIPNSSFHLGGGVVAPLPSGPPSQMVSLSQDNPGVVQPAGGAFSGLIGSLMAQGLISLNQQTPGADSLGPEFNMDLLKVRHESAINALYADLPRQCTTCGVRFKCQEEHSSHMDWHVTKNRMSKNRKQKPSRKWFVSTTMWLSGAEALGTDAGPGFLPAEPAVEKKDEEELAVPADEDQTACALCSEPFDDFYSDETEEWMYRGAVYMNAPDGFTAGLDRSQLGPIVHAKCRSESNVANPEKFRHGEGGDVEEGNQRKKMRT